MIAPIIEAHGLELLLGSPDGPYSEVSAPTDLAIYPETIVALVGPPEVGKNLFLKILAGLVPPAAGEVRWHGWPLERCLPRVAVILHRLTLSPWLTVLEHVEEPPQGHRGTAAERRQRALMMRQTIGLDGFETAYPKALSRGMQLRVGFTRALAVGPEVLSRARANCSRPKKLTVFFSDRTRRPRHFERHARVPSTTQRRAG
jgi:NitT/TauT family transport system ATP-binding protein